MVGDGWRGTVGDKRCSPEVKESIDLLLRQLCFGKEEVGKFETNMGVKGGPIVYRPYRWWHWRHVGGEEFSTLIALFGCGEMEINVDVVKHEDPWTCQ